MYATYAVAKRKPEKIQAYRDSNLTTAKTWVRAREYRKKVVAGVVFFLFHYCNPRSIASLNYYYQWRQHCRREMIRRDMRGVFPSRALFFLAPIWDYDVFCWIINKRLLIGTCWSKTKMTLLPSNCKVFETVKQDQSMQMQTRVCHA